MYKSTPKITKPVTRCISKRVALFVAGLQTTDSAKPPKPIFVISYPKSYQTVRTGTATWQRSGAVPASEGEKKHTRKHKERNGNSGEPIEEELADR
ncbi:hypothetical protein TIFTF001_002163 [Ficus carica]|uniref:Uncharacterized protein n=1 Tax=Ficus carica TaxID=3494 RepID=A0AA87ZKQ7_FICCA|nr:hypothetical protein TIFTF001_002163 [Ficus carica]